MSKAENPKRTAESPAGGEETQFKWDVPSLPEDIIEGYVLTERLAEGAMGAVFRGKQVSLDRSVAVKVLKPTLARDESFLRRFNREAKSVASLNHKNVVQAIDVGESRGWHYLIMEYVDGPTLAGVLESKGKLPEKDALRIIWQVCSALRHAYHHGFVHRDVKPENVILSSDGEAKLCDLGLAKRVDKEGTQLTALGTAMGTPNYISPEQARGETDVDIRTDIYSLGATFYHLIAGRPPFLGNSPAVVMTKHLTEDPSPVQMFNHRVSPGTAKIIEKMLAKDPADRYQTPKDVLHDLRLVISGEWKSGAASAPVAGSAPKVPRLKSLKRRGRRGRRR